MPLDPGFASLPDKVALLNDRYRYHGAVSVLEQALGDPDVGATALVSSFGAESVVLLHMISVMDRDTPVAKLVPWDEQPARMILRVASEVAETVRKQSGVKPLKPIDSLTLLRDDRDER